MKKLIFSASVAASIGLGGVHIGISHADELHPLSDNILTTPIHQECGGGLRVADGVSCITGPTSNNHVGSHLGNGTVIKNPYGPGNVISYHNPGSGETVDGGGFVHHT